MRDLMPMPERAVRPLNDAAPGVHGLCTIMVNLYAVAGPDGTWVLIDTGLYFQASRIRNWAARHFEGRAPAAILLTHGHFDHVGSLKELADFWNVPVYAHPLERPYLTGKSKYPPPDPTVGGGIFSALSFTYPRGPIDIDGRLRDLPDDNSVPGLPGWRWIPTPGHSPGHVSFFRDEDRVLIAGDAFVTTKQESFVAVATQRPELHGPPAYYTTDWEAAGLSVGRLAGLEPTVAACGHGLPLVGPQLDSALDYLATHFDDIARPVHGRYVRHPAETDENGIVRLPPPVVPVAQKALIGAAVASIAVYALTRRKPRS